ncbi:MAG: RNA polymerase sigma factor RpoD/SigA [Methanobacterium sp.]
MNKTYINLNGDDSVIKYFKEVRKSTVITPEKEVELAKRIQDGDQRAIDELVFANLKFVISIAKEYQGQGLPLSDLINEGNYGLIKAANKFDHTRGFRFISYAVWWIKQSIIQSLNDNARVIRLPSNVINKLSALKKEIEKFKLENEREPVFGDVLKDVEFDNFSEADLPTCKSLNDIISEDGSELHEVIFNQDELSDDFYEINDVVKHEIENVLSTLTPRERIIIEYYYGLNSNYEPMTLEAIGDKFGLTKERIRQIKERAIRKLRYNSEGLHDVLNF